MEETSPARDNNSNVPDGCRIYYGSSFKAEDQIVIPSEELLFEADIQAHAPQWIIEPVPHLSFGNTFHGFSFSFDLFASAFYLITEYTHYLRPALDSHGRYDEKHNYIYASGYHKLPLLNIYAELLRGKLQVQFPSLNIIYAKRKHSLSFDIDSPYLYRHKPLAVLAGGLLKDMARLNLKGATERIGVLSGIKKDPYDIFESILEQIPHDDLIFFFLIARRSGFDERHTYKNIAYRKLIRYICGKGITCGIHPSYTAYLNEDRIKFETAKLSEITGYPVKHSRMHFLRYKLPETYRHLLNAGIRHDHSSCPLTIAGFKNFIAIPFPWYDLINEEQTELWIHPSMIMDRTLQKYMQLSYAKACEKTREIIGLTLEHKGEFSAILHNNTLSDHAEWKGWQGFASFIQNNIKHTESRYDSQTDR